VAFRNAAVYQTEAEAEAAIDRFARNIMPRHERSLDVVYAGGCGWVVCVTQTSFSNFGKTYYLSELAQLS